MEKLEKPVGSVACPDAGRGLRIQVIIDRDRLGDGAVRLLQIQGRGLVFSGRGKGEGIRPGRAVKGQTGIAVGRGENDGSPVPGRRIFPHRELRPGTEDEILQARGSGADGEKGAFLTCQRVVVRAEPVPIRQREAAGIDGIAAWRFAAFSGERPGEGRRFPGYRSPIGITQFRVRLAGEFFLIRQRDDGQAGPADQQLGLSIVRIPAVLFGAEIDGVSAGIPVGGRGVPIGAGRRRGICDRHPGGRLDRDRVVQAVVRPVFRGYGEVIGAERAQQLEGQRLRRIGRERGAGGGDAGDEGIGPPRDQALKNHMGRIALRYPPTGASVE